MKPSERDISTLRHIAHYCDEIIDAINKYDLTLEKTAAEYIYKKLASNERFVDW